MKRRDLLKGLLITPFLGLLRGRKKLAGRKELTNGLVNSWFFNETFSTGNDINIYKVDSRPQYEVGTRFVQGDGWTFRYMRSPSGFKICGQELTRPIWFWRNEEFYGFNT